MDPDHLPGTMGASAGKKKTQTQEFPKCRSIPLDQIRQGFEPKRFRDMGMCSWLELLVSGSPHKLSSSKLVAAVTLSRAQLDCKDYVLELPCIIATITTS